jgi:hypothetical protein
MKKTDFDICIEYLQKCDIKFNIKYEKGNLANKRIEREDGKIHIFQYNGEILAIAGPKAQKKDIERT